MICSTTRRERSRRTARLWHGLGDNLSNPLFSFRVIPIFIVWGTRPGKSSPRVCVGSRVLFVLIYTWYTVCICSWPVRLGALHSVTISREPSWVSLGGTKTRGMRNTNPTTAKINHSRTLDLRSIPRDPARRDYSWWTRTPQIRSGTFSYTDTK